MKFKNKFKNTDFTYGLEIEGIFTNKLLSSLDELGMDVDIKEDGSVHWSEILDNIEDTDDICDDCENEVSIGVYKDYDKLIKHINLFKNGKNYWVDRRCGLHIHVKPKINIIETKELFWDLTNIKKLEKFAFSNLCDCVKKRKNYHFCESYKGLDNLLYDYKNKEKYRFVRNHPSGTLEFRFFSPCEHKAENVKKFLDYMFELMNKQEHKKSEIVNLEINLETIIKDFGIKLSSKVISKNYNIRLNETNLGVDFRLDEPNTRWDFAGGNSMSDVPF